MSLRPRRIERDRQAPRGGIERGDDLEWEAYLQAHNHAEGLGLLAHDPELHGFLDGRLASLEERYGVSLGN